MKVRLPNNGGGNMNQMLRQAQQMQQQAYQVYAQSLSTGIGTVQGQNSTQLPTPQLSWFIPVNLIPLYNQMTQSNIVK